MTDKGGATVDEVRDMGGKTIDPRLGDAIIRGTGAPVSTDHYSGFQMESKEVTAQRNVVDFRFALNKKFGESAVPQEQFFSRPPCPARSASEILQWPSSRSSSRWC